jgi:hypothetical protein
VKLYFLHRENIRKALRRIYRLRKRRNLHLKKYTAPETYTTRDDNIKMGLQGTGCVIRAEWFF